MIEITADSITHMFINRKEVFIMNNKLKKILVGIVASAMCVTGSMGAISGSAVYVDDNTVGASKNWDVRHIGNGAPSSEDISNRFYVYHSSGGHKGECKSIDSHDTTFSVVASCISSHNVSDKVWNGKGEKSWSVSGSEGHVRYDVYATGYWTTSTGHICRV